MRFEDDKIYTSCGPILIAVNPWKRLPHLYSTNALANHMLDVGAANPHPFAVANMAWCGVQRGERHSVLVSGEVRRPPTSPMSRSALPIPIVSAVVHSDLTRARHRLPPPVGCGQDGDD